MQSNPAHLRMELVELVLEVGHGRAPKLKGDLEGLKLAAVGGPTVIDRLDQSNKLFLHGRGT